MKIRLNDELIKEVIKITGVDYTGELELQDINDMIKDLIVEYNRKDEELEDTRENCKENHISKPLYYEQ